VLRTDEPLKYRIYNMKTAALIIGVIVVLVLLARFLGYV